MTDEVCRYKDEEDNADDRNSSNEIGVKTNKCKDCEKGECV